MFQPFHRVVSTFPRKTENALVTAIFIFGNPIFLAGERFLGLKIYHLFQSLYAVPPAGKYGNFLVRGF